MEAVAATRVGIDEAVQELSGERPQDVASADDGESRVA